MSKLDELIDAAPTLAVMDSFVITNNKVNNPCYENIMCSISGGADSDIMLDIVSKLDTDKKVHYVFFDTGLEFQATKDHLKYLEEKYGIEIEVERAVKPIPMACRQHGLPFLNKFVSKMIYRLQKHGFNWVDEPYEELIKKYPNCKNALMWWCNLNGNGGKTTHFCISNNKWLKEFMIANPPTFKISDLCCEWSKKKVAKKYKKNNKIDLSLYGVRKAEGGIRATAYKTCFTCGSDKGEADEYRAIFWYKNEDRKAYEEAFGVTHSKCYTEYGFIRTGCAGCPFNRNFEQDLEIIEEHEPKLFKAVNKIFGDSYEYTRKYKEFARQMREKESGQMSLFDEEE